MTGAKILVVEDEAIEALDIQRRLSGLGYIVPEIAFSAQEAVEKSETIRPDLVLMDIMLHGGIDGITAAEEIRSRLDIPVIYLTAYSDDDTLQRAKISEPYGYIVKPFNERELYVTIDIALYKHKTEMQLRESERWLATTLKSIGDAVITTDENGLITFMNPVAEQLTGWDLADARQKPLYRVFNIVNMDTGQPVENPVTRVLAQGYIVGLANHTLLITKSGARVPIDDSAAPIKDDRGYVVGVILVFRDVTERAKAERELRESQERYRALAEQLREIDFRKNEFMAVLSHELRNPLASTRNALSILDRASPGGEQARRARNMIERQVTLLSRLVDDLLDIARITQNKVQLKLQRLELNQLLRQTVEDHRLLFEKNGISLQAKLADSPLYLKADKARLAQVVGNLLNNAAKFTGPGGSARVSAETDATGQTAIIRVTDTGIGIEPTLIPRLFQPFMQADVTLNRSRGGIGLGLALSKGLIELHGGSISAHSEGAGKGAEFVISLHLDEAPAHEQQDSAPAENQASRRVLIIEDNVDIADSLCELLEFSSHKVAVAYTGPDGIAKAREFRPEAVLCDIGIPQMDGYAVARAIRSDADLRGVFLVAMTGYAFPEDLKRASDAGFDRHLAKPMDLAQINRMLAELPVTPQVGRKVS